MHTNGTKRFTSKPKMLVTMHNFLNPYAAKCNATLKRWVAICGVLSQQVPNVVSRTCSLAFVQPAPITGATVFGCTSMGEA